jgi:hypothetical protein
MAAHLLAGDIFWETSMSSTTHAASWQTGGFPDAHGRKGPRRKWEIAGIILGLFIFWPAALGYVAWKLMGYPVPNRWRAYFADNFSYPFREARFGGTGNLAFEDYRRAELARLDEERRRIDEEARAFRGYVEDLKRAKDREEFDAFMAKRRAADAESRA